MAYPLNAVASLLVLQKSNVPRSERGALTAVSAFTPGILGLAVPFVAAGAAKRGKGVFGRHRHLLSAASASSGGPAAGVSHQHPVEVPCVLGSTWAEAQSALALLDLSPMQVSVYSQEQINIVISQSPREHQLVPLNTPVTLGVSIGPPPTPPAPYTEREELQKIEGLIETVLQRLPTSTPTPTPTPTPATVPVQDRTAPGRKAEPGDKP